MISINKHNFINKTWCHWLSVLQKWVKIFYPKTPFFYHFQHSCGVTFFEYFYILEVYRIKVILLYSSYIMNSVIIIPIIIITVISVEFGVKQEFNHSQKSYLFKTKIHSTENITFLYPIYKMRCDF